MKLTEFLVANEIVKNNSDMNKLYHNYGIAGVDAFWKMHNYYLGVFNAIYTFEGVIDSDLNTIDEDSFGYKQAIDRVTNVRAYLKVPKDKFRVRVEDIEIYVEIEDKLNQCIDILSEIADYSFSCKDTCLGADCTKDFENINEFAIDGLKLFNADKK